MIFGNAPASVHRIKFYVDPQLATGPGTVEAKRRLAQYVADVNTVFLRETVRRFVFDPDVDVQWIVPSSSPKCQGSVLAAPGEIDVCVSRSTVTYSHGGYGGGTHNPKAGLVSGLNWIAIHDPLALSRTVVSPATVHIEEDYLTRQLSSLIHELEHVFDAGLGEYYDTTNRLDRTGVEPIHNLALMSTTDRYWLKRQHWRYDPLLTVQYDERYGPAANRAAVLDIIRFTAGTKAMINTDWSARPSSISTLMAGLSSTKLKVVDATTKTPLAAADVAVWIIPQSNQVAIKQVGQGATNSDGIFTFDWQAGCISGTGCLNNIDQLLLAKAWRSGRPPAAVWFSIYDAWEQRAAGNTFFTIELPMSTTDAQAPVTSLTAPATGVVGKPLSLSPSASDNVAVWGSRVTASAGSFPDTCTFQGPPAACVWKPILPGSQSIQLFAMDAAGNVSQSSAQVNVASPSDMTEPVVSLVAPATATANIAIQLSATTTDNVGVTNLKFIVDGNTLCTLAGPSGACSWTPTSAGYSTIEARASDAAGNFKSAAANTRVGP